MIISLDILSPRHMQETFGHYPQRLFGLPMHYDSEFPYSSMLAQGEDLFITGHGAHCSIGHRYGHPRFSPEEMATWLRDNVLPCGYAGDIYVYADGASPEFIDRLLVLLGDGFQSRIHGRFNAAEESLALPGTHGWMEAVA